MWQLDNRRRFIRLGNELKMKLCKDCKNYIEGNPDAYDVDLRFLPGFSSRCARKTERINLETGEAIYETNIPLGYRNEGECGVEGKFFQEKD
jgi:hypothetical protein